ncbi:hypothetical protein [Methanoculleus chikugoensis]|uniref:hypothetical protein n=1 Tax=Methanoculleus chikugoensis TaxID=118126 RepID=UPI000AD4C0F1|nr:hypothetical protein [Methanoculleus chikugoensis]
MARSLSSPPGETHRCLFKVYGLDAMLDLAPGAGKHDLIDAMRATSSGSARPPPCTPGDRTHHFYTMFWKVSIEGV